MPDEPPCAGSLAPMRDRVTQRPLEASAVAMFGISMPSRTATPQVARPRSVRPPATSRPSFSSASIAGNDRMITSAFSPPTKRSLSAPTVLKLRSTSCPLSRMNAGIVRAPAPPRRRRSSLSMLSCRSRRGWLSGRTGRGCCLPCGSSARMNGSGSRPRTVAVSRREPCTGPVAHRRRLLHGGNPLVLLLAGGFGRRGNRHGGDQRGRENEDFHRRLPHAVASAGMCSGVPPPGPTRRNGLTIP